MDLVQTSTVQVQTSTDQVHRPGPNQHRPGSSLAGLDAHRWCRLDWFQVQNSGTDRPAEERSVKRSAGRSDWERVALMITAAALVLRSGNPGEVGGILLKTRSHLGGRGQRQSQPPLRSPPGLPGTSRLLSATSGGGSSRQEQNRGSHQDLDFQNRRPAPQR